MGIDAIIALCGLVIPPVADFVKKKFLKPTADTPEATLSSLAVTSPEVMPKYIEAMTAWLKAQTESFNRDVVGTPSQWVVDLRAVIRPVAAAASLSILGIMAAIACLGHAYPQGTAETVDGVRLTCELMASSWIGSRISLTQ